jgi:hypothetical protein
MPILVFVAAWTNWHNPTLRFDSQLANEVAFLGAMLVPVIGVMAGPGADAARSDQWLLRLAVAPFAFVGLLMSLPTVVVISGTTRSGVDLSFEPIARYERVSPPLIVYRTNCGATCSYGIVVRAERRLLPGLLFVRNVFTDSPADTAVVRVLPDHRVEIAVPFRKGIRDLTGRRDTLSLPWPWSPPNPRLR